MMVEVADCRPHHLIGIAFYAAPFIECRLHLGVGREFTGVGFRQTTRYLLDLPRLRLEECFEPG
jgi:hypothetical protein